MAYHNSTPESVLSAPTRKTIFVSEQKYTNRQGRRHILTQNPDSLGLTGKYGFIPKASQEPALNEPYRKPVRKTITVSVEPVAKWELDLLGG